ncbi:MAG: hydrogenase maturation protease [Nocardioides sp.]
MNGTTQQGPLVIGLGSPDRGDDAVGRAVTRSVAARLPGVEAVEHEDPTGLLDLWEGRSPVVVVDAVCSGSPAGAVHWLETGPSGPPVSSRAWTHVRGRGSTHAVGLADMVELGRVLGRLPERLVIVGVEAACFDHGAPLTPEVAVAVPAAAERVCAAVAAAGRQEVSDVPG